MTDMTKDTVAIHLPKNLGSSVKARAAFFAAAAATPSPVQHNPANTRRCSTIDLAKKFENGQLNNASNNRTNDTSADAAIAANLAKNLYLPGHGNAPLQQRADPEEEATLALIAQFQAEDAQARRLAF